MSVEIVKSEIFGPIKREHFRLFTGTRAEFYARLIEYLDESLFGDSIEIVRPKTVKRAIEEFISMRNIQAMIDSGEPEGDESGALHDVAYARLISCGWLIEYRDRMRKIVDIDSDARLLLQALLDIKEGRVRSFGGEVLQVKTLLDAAINNPSDAAQNIHAAGSQARRFLTNLKAIAGALRRIEQEMRETRTVGDMMNSFFTSLVSDTLIQDYKNLRSQNNPYRFRHDLIVAAERLSGDSLTLGALADSLVTEGRAPNAAAAEMRIQEDIAVILKVFVMVDEHLDMIERTNARIERRIRNMIRFLDRMGDDQTGVFLDAAKSLGERRDINPDQNLPISLDLLIPQPPINAASLYRARAKPKKTPPAVARQKTPDPAYEAYQLAKERYGERARVTPQKVRNYLAAQLGDKTAMFGSDMKIETLDDFFVFERLPEIKTQFPEELQEIRITRRNENTIKNEWITCPDFEVVFDGIGNQHA